MSAQTESSRWVRGQEGQSLVEVAISFSLLVLLLGGLVDLGRAFFIYIALEDAAGEAALYAAIDPDCPWDVDSGSLTPVADDGQEGDCSPPRNAYWRAQHAGGGLAGLSLVDWSVVENVVITVDAPSPSGVGEIVRVSITYPVELIMPIVPAIVGSDTLTITATAVQVIFQK